MKFSRTLSAATLVLGSTLCAHAQFGVYGLYGGERVSNVQCQAVPTGSGCSGTLVSNHTDDLLGGGGGIFYGFGKVGPARLSVDLRGDISHSNKSGTLQLATKNAVRMDEVLGGVRASFRQHSLLRPYVEGAAGWARRDNPQAWVTYGLYPYASKSFFAYRAIAGLDVRIAPVLDVRLPDVSIGQNVGGGSNTVESVSIGIVLHSTNQ